MCTYPHYESSVYHNSSTMINEGWEASYIFRMCDCGARDNRHVHEARGFSVSNPGYVHTHSRAYPGTHRHTPRRRVRICIAHLKISIHPIQKMDYTLPPSLVTYSFSVFITNDCTRIYHRLHTATPPSIIMTLNREREKRVGNSVDCYLHYLHTTTRK